MHSGAHRARSLFAVTDAVAYLNSASLGRRSPHLHSTAADLERLVTTLQELLA